MAQTLLKLTRILDPTLRLTDPTQSIILTLAPLLRGANVRWLYGDGVPADELGNDGDNYVDNLTQDVYLKEDGAWVFETNIKGADGDPGPVDSTLSSTIVVLASSTTSGLTSVATSLSTTTSTLTKVSTSLTAVSSTLTGVSSVAAAGVSGVASLSTAVGTSLSSTNSTLVAVSSQAAAGGTSAVDSLSTAVQTSLSSTNSTLTNVSTSLTGVSSTLVDVSSAVAAGTGAGSAVSSLSTAVSTQLSATDSTVVVLASSTASATSSLSTAIGTSLSSTDSTVATVSSALTVTNGSVSANASGIASVATSLSATQSSVTVLSTATTPIFSDTAPASPVAGMTWLEGTTGIEYTWVVDGDSSQWVELGPAGQIGATGATGPAPSGTGYVHTTGGTLDTPSDTLNADGLVLPKTSGTGIKVDRTTPVWGWRDITGDINVRGTGANDPSFATFINGIRMYSFSATVMNECFAAFHIPHDLVPGTDIFFHVHWANPAATPNTGNVLWKFEYSFARGFNQAAFPATTTVSVLQACPATRYQHMVAETAAVTIANLEVDGLILCRIYRDAADGTDTCTDAVSVLTADVHYQSTNMATLNKAPNFYA